MTEMQIFDYLVRETLINAALILCGLIGLAWCIRFFLRGGGNGQ